jgi:glycosyltransferase involved in cell wall biosynthesis
LRKAGLLAFFMAQRVYIEGLFLTAPFQSTGKGRYLTNLLKQIEILTRRDSDQLTIRVLLPPNASGDTCGLVFRSGFEAFHVKAMCLGRVWRRGLSTLIAKAMGFEAFFVPESVPILAKPRRLAVNLHDIGVNMHPRDFRTASGLVERWANWSNMRTADLIFTDSEYSKNDMVSEWNVPAERIVVTYLGVDQDLFRAQELRPCEKATLAKRYGLNRDFILYVGAVVRKKNLARLIRAFRLVMSRRKDFDFQLVLCGRRWSKGYAEISDLCEDPSAREGIVLTGSVPDHDLAILYRGAACLVMPSFYEGFGLPVVEAMASGVPVICSNRSCLPEIGGDAALYFDPESVEEMSAVMERVLNDSTLRKQLTARGAERAGKFSWENCARTTLSVLKEL